MKDTKRRPGRFLNFVCFVYFVGIFLMDYPITPAIRFLREKRVEFVPHLYDYVDKGGIGESARQ